MPDLRLGVLVAVEEEASLLRSHFRLRPLPPDGDCRVYGGLLGRAALTLVVSGAGPSRALQGGRLLQERCAPELFLSVGLAGGLAGDLQVGDTVLADEVVTGRGQSWKADLSWLEKGDVGPDRVGRVLTVPRVLTLPEEKRSWGEASQALVVDMESAALAQVAQECGRPFVALRTVSDPVGEELPLDFNRFWNRRGQPELGRIVAACLRRPARIPKLVHFGQEVYAARRKMCRLLHSTIEVLSR